MKRDLRFIQEKVSSIQFGILKMRGADGSRSWQVKTAPGEPTSIHCVVTDEQPCDEMMNTRVNLVQKHNDDYLYITGRVSAEADKKTKILSIDILKASWFVRQSKGKISWLKQKYLYENYSREDMELAS